MSGKTHIATTLGYHVNTKRSALTHHPSNLAMRPSSGNLAPYPPITCIDPRSMMLPASLICSCRVRGASFSPRICPIRIRAASSPISAQGCATADNGGSTSCSYSRSSKLRNEISSGMRIPASRTARSAPIVISPSDVISPVGLCDRTACVTSRAASHL